MLFGSLTAMLILGIPVAVALAGSALLFILFFSNIPPLVVAHRMINGIDSFPLLAVPFFILAGNLMNTAGITKRIFDFALAIVGWLRGGLGHVHVGASGIFAGKSGAAVADAGGLGAIEIKAMRDAGYDDDFSVGITAASSTIGPIIPPIAAHSHLWGGRRRIHRSTLRGGLHSGAHHDGVADGHGGLHCLGPELSARSGISLVGAMVYLPPRFPVAADAHHHRRRHPDRRFHTHRGRRRRLRLRAVSGHICLSYPHLPLFPACQL